ncbi:MAG: hypothetical protein JXA54_00820 [Candidatus Heimdallarchaeota archaeon]|nr:hypothetical protein [Candidatus Heimdallarchaeota archaeon]
MVTLLAQAIPSILAIISCIIIIFLLSLNYLLNRFLPTIFLMIFFGGILLWSVTKLVSVLLPGTTDLTFVLIWKISSLSILIISLLIITFFRDLLTNVSLSIPSIVISFLAGITLAALWFGGFAQVNYNPESGWNTSYGGGLGEYTFYGILFVYLAMVYIFMFIMMFRGLRKATAKKQRSQLILIITGLAIAAIGGTILNYLLNLVPQMESFGDLDLIFVVIGFTLVAIAYLRSPIHIYFAPVSAYRLIVINNNGIPLLTHDFCEIGEDALMMDSALISAALSGVINILKETIASKATPKIINLEDRVLLIEKTNSALYALIADSNSKVLRSALKDFGNEFEKEFKTIIKDWKGLTDVFNDAYKLITEDFSFILSSTACKPKSDEM